MRETQQPFFKPLSFGEQNQSAKKCFEVTTQYVIFLLDDVAHFLAYFTVFSYI